MNSTHWPLAGVAALLLTMQAQAADGQTIYAQGGANPAAMACATCHGADAMGMAAAGFPRLAGIAAGYSRKQLEDFRSGARSNPIMHPIAAALTDEEMNAVAVTLEAMPAPTFAATTPPAADSHVINALTAYSYWLSTGAPTGQELPGRAYPEVPQPEGGFDIAKGKRVYAEQCAICHGDNGQGQKAGDGYVFPPLWGADSFNWGAGMHRINTAAAFIKESMPLGKGGTLSDADAWHVAAYMNSHERPQDSRLIEGSVEKTREKYHANDGINLYGQQVDGVLLGQGVK